MIGICRYGRGDLTARKGLWGRAGSAFETARRNSVLEPASVFARKALYVNFAPLRTPGGADRRRFNGKLQEFCAAADVPRAVTFFSGTDETHFR